MIFQAPFEDFHPNRLNVELNLSKDENGRESDARIGAGNKYRNIIVILLCDFWWVRKEVTETESFDPKVFY